MSLTDLRVHLLDQALTLALSIADDMTRAETLEGLAVAYAEAGQTTRAATILRRIWQMARHQSNPSDRQWQLRCAAEACVEANLEELAVAIAADLVRASDRASVAVDLAQHHVKAGRLSPATAHLAEALTWIRRAEEAGEGTSFIRREIAETAVDLGLIDHAVQVTSALDHHQLAVRALCAVAVRCAQTWQHASVAAIAISHATVGESKMAARLLDQAMAALEPERQAFHHVLARLAVAGACRQAGQSALAHTWLTQALARAPQVADVDRRMLLLEGLAGMACDLGEYDLALQAAHGMGPGRIKRLHPQVFHLAVIAGALAKHGDWERALKVAETIPEGGDRTSAFDAIATASIDASRYQEALQTVQRIRPPDDRAWAMVWALIRISRLRRERLS